MEKNLKEKIREKISRLEERLETNCAEEKRFKQGEFILISSSLNFSAMALIGNYYLNVSPYLYGFALGGAIAYAASACLLNKLHKKIFQSVKEEIDQTPNSEQI